MFPGLTMGLEDYFDTDVGGKEVEINYKNYSGENKTWKGILGVVELEKARTWEERRKTRPSIGELEAVQLPIFFKILEQEYQYLYK